MIRNPEHRGTLAAPRGAPGPVRVWFSAPPAAKPKKTKEKIS
jgi:hypothetical protein